MTTDPGVELDAAIDAAVDAARVAFSGAGQSAGIVESVRLVAGQPVRFRCAGRSLARHLLPTLQHLPEVDAQPVFTASAWDAASTGAPIPVLADAATGPAPARSIVGRDRSASSSASRHMFEAYDREAAEGWFAIGSAAELTTGERGAPFRLALHWWLAGRGLQFTHGGAVGLGGRGVLVVGPTGAGKSSTTLACVEDGFDYVGDDYCAVASSPRPVAYSLYSSAKVFDVDASGYSKLTAGITPGHNPADDKTLILVEQALPAQVVTDVQLAAVVVPERGVERATTFARTSARHGLQALAPSTIGQLPGGAAAVLSALAAVTRGVPSFALRLGTDRATVAPVVRGLVESLVSS